MVSRRRSRRLMQDAWGGFAYGLWDGAGTISEDDDIQHGEGDSTSRGGASTTSSMPQFDRSDSSLAQVFPPGSPAMPSTELGSAPSASSQSTHNPGAQPRTAKLSSDGCDNRDTLFAR